MTELLIGVCVVIALGVVALTIWQEHQETKRRREQWKLMKERIDRALNPKGDD